MHAIYSPGLFLFLFLFLFTVTWRRNPPSATIILTILYHEDGHRVIKVRRHELPHPRVDSNLGQEHGWEYDGAAPGSGLVPSAHPVSAMLIKGACQGEVTWKFIT
jgi:hypothetical protein